MIMPETIIATPIPLKNSLQYPNWTNKPDVGKNCKFNYSETYYHGEKSGVIVAPIAYMYEKAIKSFEKAVTLTPDDILAWLFMEASYEKEKEFDRAIKCYKRVTKLDPKGTIAWVSLGNVYRNKKEFDKAKKCFDMAREIGLFFKKDEL